MGYTNLDKDAKKCMYTGTLIGTVIIVSMISIAYYFTHKAMNTYQNTIHIVLIVGSVLLMMNLLITPHFRYKRYKYLITKDRVEVVEGYLFIKRDIVPIERIHKITLSRGPIDNFYGLSKVLLTTAGGDVTIKYLKQEEASKIAEHLKNIINEMIV